jgi:hypothetical protein
VGDDSPHLAAITSIHTAETQYYFEYGRYGRLQDLGPQSADLISNELAGGRTRDYAIATELTNDGYRITAVPRDSECHACRSFYSDQTMLIRVGKGSEFASASNTILGAGR